MKKLLQLLENDCTLSTEQMASMTNMTEDEVRKQIEAYEANRTILGYQALIDWERTDRESITALIEVNVTPQRGDGFDKVAERIYQYEEVESCYLMSGKYDMCVIISGRTLKEVALFVSEKLATIDEVTGTATHFILKKYKEKHLVFKKQEEQERGYFV
ncbi:MAG: Lrp/AsnC family transcriptional regulator [Oscillospiraceae bacterium]|nr:Lrp/AsnC family transcriptional regulator [Oscillospiraceae bacterium]